MRKIALGLLLGASLAGVAYLGFALQRTLAFARRRECEAQQRDEFTPPVTILKPLHGDEPQLFENLRSFCEQDYPEYQVIFGVGGEDDAALLIAQRVIERFPDRDLSLCVDSHKRGVNQKISSVMAMMEHAKHEVIVIADSDVRVGSSYLRAVVAPFRDSNVGAVTCLYRGEPAVRQSGSIIGELGALFINEQFAPSALVAMALAPMDFCFGATMAISRRALATIGGFQAVAAHLGDDYMLGRLVSEQGMTVHLSSFVVQTLVAEADFRSLWEHELRWARTMKSARPWGYAFSFITYALPLSLTYWALSGASVGAVLCVLVACLRLALHSTARRALSVKAQTNPALILLRDIMGLTIWAASFFGKHVAWRDQLLSIDERGRLSA